MKSSYTPHHDLVIAQKCAYEQNNLQLTALVGDAESQDYGACSFMLNKKIIIFRVAKITPTKSGQFVTVWKRLGSGPIMPYDGADQVDLFVVNVRKGNHLGQFVFPKNVLLQKGFVSKDGIGGKRAMRVYPPWDITTSQQAQKTQAWQLLYFVEIQPNIDHISMQKLFKDI